MAGSDEDHDRSRRPCVEDGGWSSTGWVLGGRTIGRSGDVVCGLPVHMEIRIIYFLVEPQNQGRRFSGLGLKIGSPGLVIWASKSP
jgi:hypothetical protein